MGKFGDLAKFTEDRQIKAKLLTSLLLCSHNRDAVVKNANLFKMVKFPRYMAVKLFLVK